MSMQWSRGTDAVREEDDRMVLVERFRIYIMEDGKHRLLATTDDSGGLGLALVTLCEEGQITQRDRIGIFDAAEQPGVWLINPWARG